MRRPLIPAAAALALTGFGGAQGKTDELAYLNPGTTGLTRSITPNGVRILTLPDDGDDRFELVALVDVGSRHDAPEPRGTAHFAAQNLLRSTRRHKTAELRHQLRRRGAVYDATTTHDFTVVRIGVSPEHWRFAVHWLGEVLAEPAFDEDEIEATRRSLLKSFDLAPGTAAYRTRAALLYPGHPLGEDVAGTVAGIRTVSPVHLRRFHANHYRGARTLVAFSGRVPVDACRQEITASLAGLPAGTGTRAERAAPALFRGATTDPFRLGETALVRVEAGYHLTAASPVDVVHQLVLAHYLRLRLEPSEESAPPDVADQFEVRLHRHARTQRLAMAALIPHQGPTDPLVDLFRGVVGDAADPRAVPFAAAQDAAARSLWVGNRNDLVTALEICWLYERLGGRADALPAELAAAPPGAVGAYARRWLTPTHAYTLLPTAPPADPLAMVFPLLLGLLAVVFVLDALRRFPIAHGLAAMLRRERVRHEEAAEAAAMTPPPVERPATDQLVDSIQEFFAREEGEERGR